ncbi:tRNA (adenosine(37)-N6)-threonylcarbamoyltransferase complex ATPase subunit type 1 TsaE [Rhizobium sp. SSA_523]|uniref:tRNA (adenosine(37)-N6)-threonylcarbamoyltransferase complex ATPase subunit type 1 TsaE n=1 Tax=Rhizobium sp. SSA_523 TaxID=2952477 RepID=UPI0020917FBF|nr:tRNA (adenosine(37)-N6)-threonylcarbamoyltransferase complex ATPase subunit type 1 TsaE [Rhizobium sp. SSA_523]MCO5734644.1 tRNA (adenosine(37)-N6)-threonylcarbamoyltransferase complex ATPase subunit type 1 TsaE [Rhizobium sp. SSA_523]WKC23417.1 tRNA (adenosine(37)-N6)-threonylcarbamoyltransferase complex ATPase subunit type 1 TsaE [Rhizobium sp. SSA_523]
MNHDHLIGIDLADEADTIRLGEDLARALAAGDCLALSGEVGAGKSTLARAFLRALADDPHLEVPSPTFTLVQTYDLRIRVSHFDLYRLADGSELHELGFDEALQDGICLVEWPEMADRDLPRERIRLQLAHKQDGKGRHALIDAAPAARARIERTLSIRRFLRAHGHGQSERRFLSGDASFRVYETITPLEGSDLILMDWPRRPEGPAVFEGKPYPKVAHLAEDGYPFVAIAHHLRSIGLLAPQVLAVDYDQGLMLLEDLGQVGVLDDQGRPVLQRYRAAIVSLAHLHSTKPVAEIPVTPDHVHAIPAFDPVAMKIETRLLLDWYLPWQRKGIAASDAERADYGRIWDDLIAALSGTEQHLLLRDYHSPNLLWQPERQAPQQVGLIDFQDAMIGPTAYDVASLVQDARVTIQPDMARLLLDQYVEKRRAQGNFDLEAFEKAFAIMSAQRNCKLAGLWVRLKERDGKPGYLQHMPRTLAYLNTVLSHPVLAPLRQWMAQAGIDFDHSKA